jgi:preprotein translocase subunit SecG
MVTLVLVIHVLLAIALVAVILMQRSEGGVLGVGGGTAGLMTARGASNLLTRATTWLTIAFVGTTIALAFLYSGSRAGASKVSDNIPAPTAPAPTAPAAPAVPAAQ